MEQTRLLVAIAISFAVFFLWNMFLGPKPQQAPQDQTSQESVAQPAQQGDVATTSKPTTTTPSEPAAQVPAVPAQSARNISVETSLYRMTFTELDAAVKSVVVKNYHETTADDSPLKELLSDEMVGGLGLLRITGNIDYGLAGVVYTADQTNDTLSVSDQPITLTFRYKSPSGLVVEKAYTFMPDTYLVDLKVNLYNGSGHAVNGKLALSLGNVMDEDSGGYGFTGPSGLIDGELEQVKVKKIEDKNNFKGNIRWVAVEDRYFMTSLILKEPTDAAMVLSHNDNHVKNQLVINTGGVAPEQTALFNFNLYAGPKSLSLLKTLDSELERVIDFGWVDFFAKPCLWFMNFVYGYIPNYGIAIIILTLVTRAMFWPLAKKSYTSMGQMRKLQPLMQEIREKYKDDKARMNQEMMTLYKTYKVNPLGGCLPMLIQLPVFYALYRMLDRAIELRHAPFFGWITDLSAPDRLFEFSSFPIIDLIMKPPYGIPILTIIMGASMLLQQKMTPSPGDPAQAKMMMLMPVVFTFIFINFSSGLVLYWLVSNIFSMAQQYYTQRKMA